MKLSLKVDDQHHQKPLLVRAKIPITVFGLPFLSGFSATAADHYSSDLSLSLRTNFPSGPSLQLSYIPTSTTAAAVTTTPPLTLTLKSGVSLSGSPNNSPLIISANFSFSPQNPNPNPTFSLQFKPRLGDFSLRKTTSSNPNPNPNPKSNGAVNSIGFVPLERPMPMAWKDLTMESATKDSILSGIAVMAKTVLPLTKRVAVNFRWGVNLPGEFGKQLPILSVNKIGIERVDEVKEMKGLKEKSSESKVGDLQMLKGMYSWMRRELDVLQRENTLMKQTLEDMKLGTNSYSYANGVGKKPLPAVENSGGFEQWRKKKSGAEENGGKETKKNVNPPSDVESELQRAIKAASS